MTNTTTLTKPQTEIVTGPQCPWNKSCEGVTDEQIVSAVKKNKECYMCLMQRYENKIIRYIKRISGVSDETAEDILQNVFLKVYINLNEFDQSLKFSTWIYRIAHNETINHWRSNSKRNDSNISWDDNDALKNVLKDAKDTESDVYQKMINTQMEEALDNLKDNYRTVVVMNYIEGLSYQEIARKLKKPIGTVGTLLNRGKKLLKAELAKIGLTPDIATR